MIVSMEEEEEEEEEEEWIPCGLKRLAEDPAKSDCQCRS